MVSLSNGLAVTAQNIEAVPEKPITKKAVESQMSRILVNSADYNDVKMVKKAALEELHADVVTLLSRNESDLSDAKAIIENKNGEIKKLQEEIAEANSQLAASVIKDETFLLFGMPLNTTLYHAIMWSLVFTLLITVGFLAVRFKKANVITQNSKAILAEVEDELETFKRNAIEREQKLRRQLQDEIIKQKKMIEAS
ncbi:hypothetical protein FCR2A7T_02040 [Flavobacterium cauense R2A-7]|uniref:Uncharacterized protein n=2 Tax=Flavobacterium TaxID=237 RepID=V6S540_9FLAO|nr:hypothetical protein FCR2A7T_02040 [Flavobacterium cauense R2A-7]KGO80979.1 hypothetical protein Q762_10075 [Flavobacterium cauense R2A-7]TWI12894.1 hypothetical protein IP98_01369 [Flavobacterium cauense R2A-7]